MSAVALALGACATPAPQLPAERLEGTDLPRFSAEDARMTCLQVADEWRATAREREALHATIEANRGHNQAVGYAAVFLPPMWLAADDNVAEKQRLEALQSRRDVLIELARAKSCPPLG